MGNDFRGEIAFKANDQDFVFRMGNGAVRQLEVLKGKPINLIAESLQEGSAILMTEVFKAGLSRHHPDLSETEIDDIIDDLGMAEVGSLISRGFKLMFPAPDTGEAGESSHPPKATTRSTGKR